MTRLRFGIEATGFVPMIQTALTSPASIFRNISTASSPGFGWMVPGGTPQIFSTAARSAASLTERWPGSEWLM